MSRFLIISHLNLKYRISFYGTMVCRNRLNSGRREFVPSPRQQDDNLRGLRCESVAVTSVSIYRSHYTRFPKIYQPAKILGRRRVTISKVHAEGLRYNIWNIEQRGGSPLPRPHGVFWSSSSAHR